MLKFRPHHFLCSLGFRGKGYSDAFVENYTDIVERLRGPGGDAIEIEVTGSTDSVCAPCPNRRGERCETQDKIDRLDRAHAGVLNLKAGDRLTWGEAQDRIAEEFDLKTFDRVCEPCGWKSLGVCAQSLTALLKSRGKIAFVLFLVGAGLSSAIAAPAKKSSRVSSATKKVEAPFPPYDLFFVDSVSSDYLKKRKNVVAAKLSKAQSALKNKKCNEVQKIASPLLGDPIFGDHATVLLARCALDEAQNLLRAKKWKQLGESASRARKLWSGIYQDFPDSSYLKELPQYLAIAEALAATSEARIGKKMQALRLFESAFQRFPSGTLVTSFPTESFHAFVKSCFETQEEPQASRCRRSMENVAKQFPKDSLEMKDVFPNRKDIPQFERFGESYERVTATYKAPDKDSEAAQNAMELYLKGERKDAIEAFREFLNEYPKSQARVRVLYWLGRALEASGDREEAKKMYAAVMSQSPTSYYGILASFAGGQQVEEFIDATLPKVRIRDPMLTPVEVTRIHRAEVLIAEKAPELAAVDLKEFRMRSELSGPFMTYVAWLNSEVGNHLAAFQIIGELLQRKHQEIRSTFGLRLIFPLAFRDAIQAVSLENRMDPVLVLSLIKQESAFLGEALSHAGAVGLMQVMPFTAIEVDTELRLVDLPKNDRNLRIGTKYISSVLKKFDGNIAFALAGYNAGPHRVTQWKKTLKPEWGLLEFVESIPFRETREYVGSIIRNYFWYAYLFHGVRLQNLDYFWGISGPSDVPLTLPTKLPAPTENVGVLHKAFPPASAPQSMPGSAPPSLTPGR